jgi:SNF2 family DNA or RNA helicase
MDESNLHPYQLAAVSHIIENKAAGLFMDMGLGKTISVLTAIDKLMHRDLEISTALIVAPKRVAENVWPDELEKWRHLSALRASRVIGTAKQREAALKKDAELYLVSRDNIAWLCGLYGGLSLPFDMLVIDESSSFKNPKSQRFKALRRVRSSFSRAVILTGTPSPNGLEDLWAQMYLLDQGERLGKYITHYRRQFFRPGQTNGAVVYNYKPLKGSQEAIFSRIGDIVMSMKAKDYLSLPERVDNFVKVKFSSKLQKQYNEFEKQSVLELFSGPKDITAANAAALSNKLLQFANGAVYDEGKTPHEVHKMKLDALEEIVEDANGSPVLVAYTYQHDEQRIMQRLKKYKPVKMKSRAHIQAWNRGEIQVMAMHPASGGHGLNLQKGGNVIVWFGQTWSLELYQQLNARLHRQGQSKPVMVHHLIADKTIDLRVADAIKAKDASQEQVLAATKGLVKKYMKDF